MDSNWVVVPTNVFHHDLRLVQPYLVPTVWIEEIWNSLLMLIGNLQTILSKINTRRILIHKYSLLNIIFCGCKLLVNRKLFWTNLKLEYWCPSTECLRIKNEKKNKITEKIKTFIAESDPYKISHYFKYLSLNNKINCWFRRQHDIHNILLNIHIFELNFFLKFPFKIVREIIIKYKKN